LIGWLQGLARGLREQGWWVLVAVLLIGGALWGFAELVDEVQDGETHEFDRAVMLAMQRGPSWLGDVARDITSLGGATVLVLLSIGAIGYLLMNRRWQAAVFITVAVAGGALISAGLKQIFARPRPDLLPHAVEVTSASFPSGHAMLAMTTYLTLGAVLAEVEERRRLKIYVLLWATLLALLVGLSRIYLGVHWPTDVLAGWCVGSAWALLCGSVALWLQRRGLMS